MPNDAECCTLSAKGSREPVGFSPIDQKGDHGLELGGQRHGDRHRRAGATVVRPGRRIVIADRVGHRAGSFH